MRIYLLLCFYLSMACCAFAQAPAIEGDLMLCPYTNGTATITTDQAYDSYQWYYKYWFLSDDYAAIEGANSASFTYDWLTYDQALLKVVVTLNGQTYESNSIQVDSYAWASLFVMHEFDESQVSTGNNGELLLCGDATVTNTVGMPYTVVQWYKDDQPIAGATSPTYVITEPGEYYVVAAPGFCPNSSSTSIPFVVADNPNCETPGVVAPVIDGDVMLCPDTNGTATVTNEQTYDTYQWQLQLYGEEEFNDIEGATEASFTYDAYNYSATTLRLVVTVGDDTYTSNELFVDGYAWAGLFIVNEFDTELVSTNPENGNFMMCDGATITNTVNMPYTIIQWYKDGEAIEGATSTTYVITEPGEYYVTAAPDFCPNSINTSIPFVAEANPECTAGVNNPNKNAFTLYPNPAQGELNVNLAGVAGANAYTIYDVTGKTLQQGMLNSTISTINVSGLASGSYLVKISGENGSSAKMFIKE